jgi:hypothetical protein
LIIAGLLTEKFYPGVSNTPATKTTKTMSKLVTPIDHLRAFAAQIYREGRRTDADTILGHIQAIEAQLLPNVLIADMKRVAAETSAKIDGAYTTVELSVKQSGDRTIIDFQGYTESGGHTRKCETLAEVEALILPDKAAIQKKAKELRAELAKLEAMAGGAK